MKGKARTTDDDDIEYEEEAEDELEEDSGEKGYFAQEESVFRIELNERISSQYKSLIGDKESKKAIRSNKIKDPVVDSSATTHYSPFIKYFELLDQ